MWKIIRNYFPKKKNGEMRFYYIAVDKEKNEVNLFSFGRWGYTGPICAHPK